jgi:hypothetical protein
MCGHVLPLARRTLTLALRACPSPLKGEGGYIAGTAARASSFSRHQRPKLVGYGHSASTVGQIRHRLRTPPNLRIFALEVEDIRVMNTPVAVAAGVFDDERDEAVA